MDFSQITARPEWMRPPQWRWLVAMMYLADTSLRLQKLDSDGFARESAQFYRAYKFAMDNDRIDKCKERYAEAIVAFDIFMDNRLGGWKWMIEAYLMSGCTDSEIVDRLKVKMDPGVIQWYRRMFFDIDSYRDSEAAIFANILSTARINNECNDVCDYTWKVIAWQWGADIYEKMFLRMNGIKETDEYARWMEDFTKRNLTTAAFQLSSRMKSMYSEQVVRIMEISRTYWILPGMDNFGETEQTKRRFLDNIQGAVNLQLQAVAKEEHGTDRFEMRKGVAGTPPESVDIFTSGS